MRLSLHYARMICGKNPIGVEVGVEVGINARSIVDEWTEVKKLYLVENNIAQYDAITKTLEGFFGIYELIKKSSVEASKDFEDNSLDFVYIDADHSYQSVMNDLNAWYSKVKVGGIICGHDFADDVQKAVIEFFYKNSIKLNCGDEDFWGIKKE